MKVVIIGRFPEQSKQKIIGCFPEDWQVCLAAPEEVGPYLRDADAVIPEHVRVDRTFLDRAPGLKMVQTGAGFDNVDIGECTRRGIWVCNAAGVNAAAVAEHVMAFILCWYKNVAVLDRFIKDGGEESGLDYRGGELAGKTVGIVGLGAIGRKVAQYCAAFDMRVLGYSYRPAAVPEAELVDLDTLLAESDIVTLHVPLKPETRRMMGREAFGRMKKDALLVNTSRGAIVDETQLAEALRSGEIGGACLDVYEEEPLPQDSPLRGMPNVLLTPHTAGLPDGVKFHEKRYRFFAGNIARAMAGQMPENVRNQRPPEG